VDCWRIALPTASTFHFAKPAKDEPVKWGYKKNSGYHCIIYRYNRNMIMALVMEHVCRSRATLVSQCWCVSVVAPWYSRYMCVWPVWNESGSEVAFSKYVRRSSIYWQVRVWFAQFKETGSVEKQKSTGRRRTLEEVVERIGQSCIRTRPPAPSYGSSQCGTRRTFQNAVHVRQILHRYEIQLRHDIKATCRICWLHASSYLDGRLQVGCF
jgi:hypothetical protein